MNKNEGQAPMETPNGRALSRNETHDLSMIIKDRTRVLKAHAEEQAAALMADFETKLAAQYTFDQDDVWKAAAERAQRVVAEAGEEIARRCEELGIPKTFAPRLHILWSERGENAVNARRVELRRVAKTTIEAMTKTAMTTIEKQGLDLRTQVVAMGLLSDDAKLFLGSLAPVEDAMAALDFKEMEKKLENERPGRDARMRRLSYGLE